MIKDTLLRKDFGDDQSCLDGQHIQKLFELDFVNYKSKLKALQNDFHHKDIKFFREGIKKLLEIDS